MIPERSAVPDRVMVGMLLLHLVALFVGTLMPDSTRNSIALAVDPTSSFHLSAVAHFALFASMSVILRCSPFRLPPERVMLVALGLALLSEGLQFFTPDRHPRWIDVVIDCSGALVGLGFGALVSLCFARL